MDIRDNCGSYDYISYEEAALISGLSKSRIKSLASEIRDGKRLFAKGNAVGPYKVDRKSFEEFLRTGKPCGPINPNT